MFVRSFVRSETRLAAEKWGEGERQSNKKKERTKKEGEGPVLLEQFGGEIHRTPQRSHLKRIESKAKTLMKALSKGSRKERENFSIPALGLRGV